MTSAFNRLEMKWQDWQVISGQHHSPSSRSVPWEVSHLICVEPDRTTTMAFGRKVPIVHSNSTCTLGEILTR